MKQEVTSKKVFIRTLGCQMNVRDSEVVCGLLKANGYQLTDSSDAADIVIFNTCSVRQHAEDKVWSEIGRITKSSPHDLAQKTRQIKTGGSPRPTKIMGLVGCMAQNYKDAVFERCPQVDFVVGPSDIHKIPSILKTIQARIERDCFAPFPRQRRGAGLARTGDLKIWETDGQARPEEIYHSGFYGDEEHAYVVISEGCSNYCSYCVVPYVRGELRHRHHKDILSEIKEAVAKGITKITLLGQNVNAYQDGEVGLVKLVGLVELVKGLEEFSFITSHPKDAGIELFQAMADCEKLRKYLHLPAQSGSDKILKLMNRGYTRKFYLDLSDNYRKIVNKGALTTDIIVGFPTETEEDFKQTYDLVKAVEFNSAYIFKYSPRPHTAAAELPDDVEKKEKERRHGLILEMQKEISQKAKIQKGEVKTTS